MRNQSVSKNIKNVFFIPTTETGNRIREKLAERINGKYTALVAVECDGVPVIGPEGAEETDHWLNFIATRSGCRNWHATWTPPDGISYQGKCRLKVLRPGLEPLVSEAFYLRKNGDSD